MKQYFYILLFFFSINQVFGQESISYGTDLTSTISAIGEVDSYIFQGNSGDIVLLRMRGTPSGVDACISLLNSNGDTLAIACGSGLSTFSHTLSEEGTYTVQASDNNDNDTGEYGLSLEALNNLDPAVVIAECEADITGTLEHRSEVDAYTVSVGSGEQLRIRMRGVDPSIEARFQLYSSNGTLLTTSQIQAGIADADPVLITEAGAYLLLAMDHRGNDVGSYGLSVERILSDDCASPIGCGAEFTAELTAFAQIDAYRFEASEGDVITALMRGIPRALEGYMELYDPAGNRIATSVSYEHLSRLDPIRLPSTGIYKILAMDNTGNDIGEYAFSLQFTNAADCVNEITCENKDDLHRLGLIAEIDAYALEGREGDVVNLVASEEDANLELRMELYSPDGTFLRANTGRHGAVIEKYTLPESGTYTVLILDNEGNDRGNYIFSIGTPILEVECAPTYCESAGQSSNYEWIESVTINDVVIVSGNDGGYGNHTDNVIDVYAGGFYTFSATPGFGNGVTTSLRECYRVWIDLNQDLDFDDEGELLYRGSDFGTISGSMVIPADALTGNTRMRVSMSYTSYPTSCESIIYGEVEDYTINIKGAIACGDLPVSWFSQDIGSPDVAGSTCYQSETGTFVVNSNGYDIFKKKDNFHFAYTEIDNNDNLTFIARVSSITRTANTALAGIMMRESLAEDSKNVLLAVSAGEGGYFQFRKRTNKNTTASSVNVTSPRWLKLKREGNKFTAYTSHDGVSWTEAGTTEVSMSENFYLGLAVTSFDSEKTNIASFDQVSYFDNPGLVEEESEELGLAVVKEELNIARAVQEEFVVYPNPARGFVNVTTNAVQSEQFQLILYSTAGQRIMQQEFQNNGNDVKLEWLNPLPTGHYRLILQDGKEMHTQNVMIVE